MWNFRSAIQNFAKAESSSVANRNLSLTTNQLREGLPLDAMWRSLSRNPNFRANELDQYIGAAIYCLPLPAEVRNQISKELMGDLSAFMFFYDRLSSQAQEGFVAHFCLKSGFNRYEVGETWSAHLKLLTKSIIPSEEQMLTMAVLQRRFPADFALYRYPEYQGLRTAVASKSLNRLSSYSLFDITFNTYFENQLGAMSYQWNESSKKLVIASTSLSDVSYLSFKYDKVDQIFSQNLLSVCLVEEEHSRFPISIPVFFQGHTGFSRMLVNEGHNKIFNLAQ